VVSRASVALVVAGVTLLLLFLYVAELGVASPGRVYVVFDSCGYETVKALVSSYPEAKGEVHPPGQLPYPPPQGAVVVLLVTNISPRSYVEQALAWAREIAYATYITTDLLNLSSSRVSSTDIWLYCTYGDSEALRRIAEVVLGVNLVSSTPHSLSTSALAVSAVLVATSITLLQVLREKVEDFLKKVGAVIVPPLLRFRVSREEALEHPLRRAIYEAVASAGALRYKDLMKFGSRATIDWHLWILTRSKLLVELRVGRGRYIVNILNPSTALNALIKLDEGVRCVVENSGGPPQLIAELCGVDPVSIYSILELHRRAGGGIAFRNS